MGKLFGSRLVEKQTNDRIYDDDGKEWYLYLEKENLYLTSENKVGDYLEDSYIIKQFDILEESRYDVSYTKVDGHLDWQLRNISKKKVLLLESLGLLGTLLLNRKKKHDSNQRTIHLK